MDAVCERCGASRNPAWRFCSACGAVVAPAGTSSRPSDQATARATARPAPPSAPPAQPTGWPAPPDRMAAGAPAPSTPAFLSGDWSGALLTGASALAVMALPGMVAMIVVAGQAVVMPEFADLAVLVPLSVALSAGGAVNGRLDLGFVSADVSLAVMPLLATLLGLGVAASIFLRRLRPARAWPEAAVQAARVGGVFLAGLLLVALLGRRSLGATSGTAGVRVSVDVASTLTWGAVWLLVALAVALAWRRPDLLPAAAAPWRETMAGPAAGTGAVLSAGWLSTLALVVAALLSDAARGPETVGLGTLGGGFGTGATPDLGDTAAVAALILAVPNLLVAGFGYTLGVPFTASTAGLGPSGPSPTSLLELAAQAPAVWLGPLVTTMVVIFGGVVAALHAPTPQDALRRGWMMGVPLAAAMLVAAGASTASLSVPASGGSLHLDYLLAPALGLAWGAGGGTLGALLAPGLPENVIRSRRTRLTVRTPPDSEWAMPPGGWR